jgi:predicted transcriptional regulator
VRSGLNLPVLGILLNEAVDAYLDVQRWQIEHIRKGLAQAEAGMGTDHEEVRAKWKRRLR